MKLLIPITFLTVFVPLLSSAQSFPTGFSNVLVAQGVTNPTVMEFAPDGRIFVAQQDGALRIIKNGTLLPAPAIDLDVDAAAERGLVGITLHPQFTSNNWIYLYYTVNETVKRNRISRFTLSGDVINPSSEVIILNLDPLDISPIHNGGCMKFGQDGKLYVTIGDNNRSDDAQNPDTYWGKMIRINEDGSVPSDNPFVSATSEQKKRLWAMGMRNPFTFDIQQGTGKIFINEVGHALWEEIQDASTPGLNFGWPLEQGINPTNQYTNPFYAYGHGDGTQVGCAISGGCFFNPAVTNYPSQYIGKYFFIDYCEKWIGYIHPSSTNSSHSVFASDIASTTLTLKVGPDGNLYYLGRDKGSVYKIIYTLNSNPVITDQPDDLYVARTQNASFSVSVSGTPPFTYAWKKNGTSISGATSSSYTIGNVQLSDSGRYSVVITTADGSVSSAAAKLSVSSEYPPVASILSPLAGTRYIAGSTIEFSGTGTDQEDGVLPASAFTWKLEFHHGTGSNLHIHDGPPIATGVKSGSYMLPKNNETSSEVFYRLILIVKDTDGFTSTKSIDLLPEKSTITLTTNPPNLRLTLDGTPRSTPISEQSVEGIERTIGVISPQQINGIPYVFDKWSNSGAATQVVVTPSEDITYTAIFREDTDLRVPENPSSALPGLTYEYYEGIYWVVPEFNKLSSAETGIVSTFNLSPRNREDQFAFKFTGYIDIPTDGMYTFYALSNDGSKLYIGNRLIINNDGEHNNKEVSGAIGLKAGKHAIAAGYFEGQGNNILTISYSGPGIAKQEIPASRLFYTTGSVNNAPVVSITSPSNNQSYPASPAVVVINVNATDPDGSISKVEFYNGVSKLGEDATSPFEFTWNNVVQGNYSLSAKAFDNQNASTISSSVSISVAPPTSVSCPSAGSILREYWNNISGSTVSTIPVSTTPSGTQSLTFFEGPVNSGDNYGTRIRGYVCPPLTGNYYFWIASNDNGELWLSTDSNSANKVRIAYVGSYTASREWTKLTTQQSVAIRLESGKVYYIEALHKEGANTDHIAVGWQLPDGSLERPIPGNRLIPFKVSSVNNPPTIRLTSPVNNQQFDEHAHILISAQASDQDGGISKVEFYQNSIKLGEDLTAPYEFIWDHPEIGQYALTAKAYDTKNAVATSSVVTIKIVAESTVCSVEGKIVRDVWSGISGDKVTDIPTHIAPSATGYLTIFEGPQNVGDKYGARLKGTLCAPQTGIYYFWISSNDNGELWLSTNHLPDYKQKIASVPTFSNYQEWGKFASQKSIGVSLTEGQTYYIEALHKEGYNSDHVSVGWQLPDGTLERPIPGSRLSPPSSVVQREAEQLTEYPLEPESIIDSVYSISAFPNPTEKGMITLSIKGYAGKTKASIYIYDSNGRKKHTESINCDITCPRTLINIDERFPEGTYIIRVLIDGRSFSQKLIVR